MATASGTRLAKILKELDAVSAKLKDGPTQGARRLKLLQRQATLGDQRDAVHKAERRRSLDAR